MAVPGQKLVEALVRQVVRVIQIQGDQIPDVTLFHKHAQNGVVETVQLAGAQKLQIRYPDQHVDQTLGGEVGAGYVQFLNRRFLPFHLHQVLAYEI